MLTRLLATAACVIGLVIGPGAASAATPQTNLADVEDEVMCTVCGTLLELSEAPQAERQRALIRRLIDEGKTKDEIKDALVAEYGSEVLATPSGSGFDLIAWLVPGIGIAAGIGAIAFVLVRRRRRPGAAGTGIPEPDSSDLNRLERDMSSYDL